MSNYLIVAHQTANSPDLLDSLLAKTEVDPDAQFVLLVPATSVEELRMPVEHDSQTNAETVATRAIYALNDGGVRLLRAGIGNASPLLAIQEEVVRHPGFYDEVILCSLPVDFSRWLSMDIPAKIEAMFQLPVTHVYGWAYTSTLELLFTGDPPE